MRPVAAAAWAAKLQSQSTSTTGQIRWATRDRIMRLRRIFPVSYFRRIWLRYWQGYRVRLEQHSRRMYAERHQRDCRFQSFWVRSEEHTSELQSRENLVC